MKPKPNYISPVCLLFLLVSGFLHPIHVRANSVLDSKHNLSASGPGTLKAATERDVCIFCHTPHRAGGEQPLWNHKGSNSSYIPYSSATMKAVVGQPNGASKLCLSCHDGTVALGMVNSGSTPISMQGGVSTMPSGAGNLGTDLSQNHPISFTYDSALTAANGQLRDPTTLTGKVKLDHNSQMQCTACHNPHDDQYGKFLVMENTGSALCATCHNDTLWTSSAHNTSTAPLSGMASALSVQSATSSVSKRKGASTPPVKPGAKTVAANACNNCHAPHKAAGHKQLLLNAREEQTCFTCHNGTVGRQNLQAEFSKISVHPVLETSQLHNSGEDLVNGPRHVSCSDCHNSHAAKRSNSNATRNSAGSGAPASGAILGVKGVNRSGSLLNSVTREYELCFRCHGDNVVRKAATVNRITPETNTRQAFNPANRSYHPVVAAGKNSNVPSLLPPYTTGATIGCIDCHNNDQGPGAGGTGPSGPHGSAFAPLLERRLITTDQVGESAANYALCYKCHSRDSILSDQSFRALNSSGKDRGHRFHIVDQKAACTTCHDSHGVANNMHLINFNPQYVTAASNGRIEYKSTGILRGNCTLTCHGANHVGATYPDPLVLSPALQRFKR